MAPQSETARLDVNMDVDLDIEMNTGSEGNHALTTSSNDNNSTRPIAGPTSNQTDDELDSDATGPVLGLSINQVARQSPHSGDESSMDDLSESQAYTDKTLDREAPSSDASQNDLSNDAEMNEASEVDGIVLDTPCNEIESSRSSSELCSSLETEDKTNSDETGSNDASSMVIILANLQNDPWSWTMLIASINRKPHRAFIIYKALITVDKLLNFSRV